MLFDLLHLKIEIQHWGVGAQLLAALSFQRGDYLSFELKCSQSNFEDYFTWYFEGNQRLKSDPTMDLIHPSKLEILRGIELFFKNKSRKIRYPTNINQHINQATMLKLRQKANKNIRFNEEILQKTKMESTLAIHYRGTDKPEELYKQFKEELGVSPNHFTQNFDKLFKKARELQRDLNLQNIMFITDDEQAADLAKANHFIVLDRRRCVGDLGIHYVHQDRKDLDDAVEDLAYIGMADYLLLGRSCYSAAALILAPNLRLGYEYYN